MPWMFKDFLDGNGQNVILVWLNGLPVKARTKINVRIDHLSREKALRPPDVQPIHGFDGIFEIRVIRQNIQYRPLGCYGPGRGEFTILLGAIEQGDRIHPPNAFETAAERHRFVMTGRSKVCDHNFGKT